jgi:uncharacterized protein YndB with AHSA1/START domain
MSADTVTFETELDSPPETVWRALAEPALREAWLGEGGEVVEAQPTDRLVLRWTRDEPPSVITFDLRPGEGGGAHLTIVHSAGLARLAPAPARRAATLAGGWRMAA